MTGVRLPPAARDLLLTLFDRLVDGSVKLRDRLILSGRIVGVTDELFAGASSQDRLPAMAGEAIRALYMLPEPPRTYGAACRLILLEHSAVETRRAEETELAEMTQREAEVEARRIRAADRSEAEKAAAAERRLRRRAKAKAAPARAKAA